VKVSRELVADSDFDLVSLLDRFAVKRLARGMQSAVTIGKDHTGSTTSTPNSPGFLSQITSTVTNAGTIAASTTTSAIVPLLAQLQNSLDDAYRPNAVFQMSQQTRSVLGSILTTTGAPLFPSLERILDTPVVINNSLPSILTASATGAIVYGDPSSIAIRIDRSPRIQPLFERGADVFEIWFVASYRFGSTLLDANGLGALVQAAS
jgi:HK97 family phage major capsid protein